VNITEHL